MKRYFGSLLCCLFVVRSALATERWAIVVGIGNYPQSSGWRAINGDKDLDLVVPMLKKNGFPDSHLTILANEQATKKNIAKAILTLLANLRAGDIVYFHFSGHGQLVTDVNGDEDTIFDLYQDTCVALYDRIRSGKLRMPNPGTKLKNLLFTIGHNQLVDLYRKNKSRTGFIENIDYKKDYDSEYSDECSERFTMVRRAVGSMTEPCNSILTLYYWDDKNMQEIAEMQGYANADSAKSQKSKCMNKLRVYIKNFLE